MSERTSWSELRDKRMAEPGAADAYRAALALAPPEADARYLRRRLHEVTGA